MKYSSRFVQSEAYFSCQSPNVWVTRTGESLFLMGGIIRHMQTCSPKGLFLPSFLSTFKIIMFIILIMLLFSGPDSLLLLSLKEQESSVSYHMVQRRE